MKKGSNDNTVFVKGSVGKSPMLDRQVSEVAALEVLRDFAGSAPPNQMLTELPAVGPFYSNQRIESDVSREMRRRLPRMASICRGLEKDLCKAARDLQSTKPDLKALADGLEASVRTIARATSPYSAHIALVGEEAKLGKMAGSASAEDQDPVITDFSDAELATLAGSCQRLDEDIDRGLGVERSRIRPLVAGGVCFVVLLAVLSMFFPGDWMIAIFSATGAFLIGFAYQGNQGTGPSSAAKMAFFAMTEDLRSQLATYFDQRYRTIVQRYHANLALGLLKEWQARPLAQQIAACSPSAEVSRLAQSMSKYPSEYLLEVDPGEVHIEGLAIARLLFESRLSNDRDRFIREVRLALSRTVGPRSAEIGPEELSAELQRLAIEVLHGPFGLTEVLSVVLRDNSARLALSGRLRMVSAAVRDPWKFSNNSALDSTRKPGAMLIGYPESPVPDQISKFLINEVTPTPRICLGSDLAAIEVIYSLVNVPTRHSWAHQLGEQALAEHEDNGLWRYPRELREGPQA